MKALFFLLCITSLWANYPQEYEGLSEQIGKPIAVAMTAYNRPDYLKRSLEALAQNPESQELPLLFLLDGGPTAKQKELTLLIDSFHFPHCYIIAFPENLGCERNMVELRSFIFDYCQFEKCLVMEDDLLLPPNGIGLLLRMHAWAEENIPHFGILSLCSKIKPKKDKKQLLSFLTEPVRKECSTTKNREVKKGDYWNMRDSPQNASYYHIPPYWVYCMSKEVWNKIRDTQLEFLARFIDRENPHYLDHPAVRHWILGKLLAAKPLLDPAGAAILGNPRLIPIDSGQDGVIDICLRSQGLRYIVPAVNRIANIGEYGEHFASEAWRFFCKDLFVSNFSEDTTISEFHFAQSSSL